MIENGQQPRGIVAATEADTKNESRRHSTPKGGARPGAGHPRKYPEGSRRVWLVLEPELVERLGWADLPDSVVRRAILAALGAPPSPAPAETSAGG